MAIIKVKFSRAIEGATNIVDSGTEGTRVATGTTAQRGSTAGQLRFNSDTGLAEYYDGTDFKSIDTAPTISSISPSTATTANQNITITGSNFGIGATVKFVGNDGTEYASPSVTRNSSTEIVAQTPATVLPVANEPYDVIVNNQSGLSASLEDALDAGSTPSFTTASGSLGTLFDSGRAGSNLTSIVATDADGQSVTFSLKAGSSVPSGLTLNSDGTFSGTADTVGSDTTTTFTVVASDGTNTNERQFSITVRAPVIQAFNTAGTFTVPSGLEQVSILVVAGGGAGGTTSNGSIQSYRGAGGGAGGVILIPNWNVTGASSYSINIGQGGTNGANFANNGGDTTVSGGSKTLTAIGGGRGGWSDSTDNGATGGSGGSDWFPTYPAQAGTQPINTNDGVNTYNGTGYGNASGSSLNSPPYSGGGGGAGSAGMNAIDASNGATSTDSQGNSLTGDTDNAIGGTGLYIGNIFGTGYGESGFVASGGTGTTYQGQASKAHLGGGGIGDNTSNSTPSSATANGQANTGGGGGSGGNGGSGLVLIAY